MAGKKPNIKFEDAVKRLEEIVAQMDNNDIPLEESIKVFQEGMELAALCNKKLDEAERKISMVLKSSKGKFEEKPFDEEQEIQ